MRFETVYVYDGHTGRLIVAADKNSVCTEFLPDGFAVVNDHRGQQFRLKAPVVVEETTTGNGGYIVTHWFGFDDWWTSRHHSDASSVEDHLRTAGFALRYNPSWGEHRVLTPSGNECYPTRGILVAASLVTKW